MLLIGTHMYLVRLDQLTNHMSHISIQFLLFSLYKNIHEGGSVKIGGGSKIEYEVYKIRWKKEKCWISLKFISTQKW